MTPETRKTFASLENSLRSYVAIFKGVDRARLTVSIVPEIRDGKQFVLVDVLLDGKSDAEGENLIRESMQIALPAAEFLLGSMKS